MNYLAAYLIIPEYFTFPMRDGTLKAPADSSDGSPPDDDPGLQGPVDTDAEIDMFGSDLDPDDASGGEDQRCVIFGLLVVNTWPDTT